MQRAILNAPMSADERNESGVVRGARRYCQKAWRAWRATQTFRRPETYADAYVGAIRSIQEEDEEIPLPVERGPVVFRDGIFQIDMNLVTGQTALDPELKKLIDSILGSTSDEKPEG